VQDNILFISQHSFVLCCQSIQQILFQKSLTGWDGDFILRVTAAAAIPNRELDFKLGVWKDVHALPLAIFGNLGMKARSLVL
jgi:hypothetical protein